MAYRPEDNTSSPQWQGNLGVDDYQTRAKLTLLLPASNMDLFFEFTSALLKLDV